jgi:hypothetical protein
MGGCKLYTYYEKGKCGERRRTGQQGRDKITKQRGKERKNHRSISVSFFTKKNETVIAKDSSLHRLLSSRTQHPRSVASRCSVVRTDQINTDQQSVGTPSLQTFDNTAARSHHRQDSKAHDTRSHHRHTRPDRHVHQGSIADLSLPKRSLWSRRRTPDPLSVHAS